MSPNINNDEPNDEEVKKAIKKKKKMIVLNIAISWPENISQFPINTGFKWGCLTKTSCSVICILIQSWYTYSCLLNLCKSQICHPRERR